MSNSILRDRRFPMRVDVDCSISKEQTTQFAMTIYDEMAKYLYAKKQEKNEMEEFNDERQKQNHKNAV